MVVEVAAATALVKTAKKASLSPCLCLGTACDPPQLLLLQVAAAAV
jgi:hypothetical protein